MFVSNSKRWYSYDGQQHASGRFLCLFSDRNNNIWGVVRKCSLHQCGHFMMGTIRVGNQTLTMSGTYGGDGIPKDINKIEPHNMKYLTPMPKELVEIFWKGGGWNTAGGEAWDVYEWGQLIDPKR